MTKSELIERCYKELKLDPQKNPQSLQQIIYNSMTWDGYDTAIVELMAQYIDAQEEE